MKFTVSDSAYDANGTSLKGYVTTYFADLVEVFGDPLPGSDKTNAEWIIVFQDGLVATIYDWKTCEIPMDEYEWHIGGKSYEVVQRVQQIIEDAREAFHNVEMTRSVNSWTNWEN